jgi:ariadne-1
MNTGGAPADIQCACGYRFCFKCNREAHAPSSCENLVKWLRQCQDDGETHKWIMVNTKDCPKCNSAIEKNGGCNHMTCRKCTYEFCWICSGPWLNHVDCNAYKATEREESLESTRKSLAKYLFYYDRYQTHDQSKKLESTLEKDVRIKELQLYADPESARFGVDFIGESARQLIECRRVLKYTYVYAYYLPENTTHKIIFEDMQAQLQNATEHLSDCLQHFNGLENRSHLVNMTTNCRKRLSNLMALVEDEEARLPEQPSSGEGKDKEKDKDKDGKGKGKEKKRQDHDGIDAAEDGEGSGAQQDSLRRSTRSVGRTKRISLPQ